MGSSLSRPTSYPFPVPKNDSSFPSKFGMWSFPTKKKSTKGREHEKLDDFLIAKYPPTTTYPMSYYPQMQSAFPAYYAPVQMAFVQPVLAMPQGYVPMAYQTATAPVQPAITQAPAVQLAQAVQMPVLPQASTAPPTAPRQMPQPQPPPTIPAQIPQPQPPPPPMQGPVIPPSPVPADHVIPPPPIVHSDPRNAPDSARIRFTDFYRPTDHPSAAGPPGRTPYSGTVPMPVPSSTPAAMPMPAPSSSPAPMPMPTPVLGPGPPTIPRLNNPLPLPPADVWDTSPYRHVLANLPAELPDLVDLHHHPGAFVDEPEPISRSSSRLAGLFGRDKGKKPLKGLFRSRGTAEYDMGAGSSRYRHSRSHTMASIVIPPPVTAAGVPGSSRMGTPRSNLEMPVPTVGPPIKFDHTGEYSGFVNHSPHRVMYKNKLYPTALHLLEALKFTHQPSLQERIRTCKDVNDMYPLSASLQEHVRPDWGQVFLKVMEEVLYLKFKQHPTLRALLLRTGLADIIYADENRYWGDGPLGDGANELGKALARLRERLQHEGEN